MEFDMLVLCNQHGDIAILGCHEWQGLQNTAKQYNRVLSKGKKDYGEVKGSKIVKAREARKMAVALKRAAQSRKDALLFDKHKPFNKSVAQELGDVFFRTHNCAPALAISRLRSMVEHRCEILEIMFLHRFAEFCEEGQFKIIGSSLLFSDLSET